MKKNLKRPKFQAWLERHGDQTIAHLLGVDRVTVMIWRRGKGYPRVAQMRTIKKLTRGRIRYEDIIDGGAS